MGLRNIMNNYFYGKQGKADMTVADLPANRRQLFGTVLRVRWSQMIGLNLLYMIIWIPAIIWTIMNLMLLNSAQVTDAREFTRADVLSVISTWLLIMIPCVASHHSRKTGKTIVISLRREAAQNKGFQRNCSPLRHFNDSISAMRALSFASRP